MEGVAMEEEAESMERVEAMVEALGMKEEATRVEEESCSTQ